MCSPSQLAYAACLTICLWPPQGGSCSLAVASQAYAGTVPAKLDIAASYEAPSVVAARHAKQYATNVHPVGDDPRAFPLSSALSALGTTSALQAFHRVAAALQFLSLQAYHQDFCHCCLAQEAAASAAMGPPRAEGFELDLLGCKGTWLAEATLLLGLASGQLVLVSLQQEGGGVRKLKVGILSVKNIHQYLQSTPPETAKLPMSASAKSSAGGRRCPGPTLRRRPPACAWLGLTWCSWARAWATRC